jgi:hypothetical protein
MPLVHSFAALSLFSPPNILLAATMGTLTADLPRLPEYCDHKLPTSCRLSSIPNCCACADERAHQSSYSTYVDGVGFVARGARWDRYCWPCSRMIPISYHRVTALTAFRVLEKQSSSNKFTSNPNTHPTNPRSVRFLSTMVPIL